MLLVDYYGETCQFSCSNIDWRYFIQYHFLKFSIIFFLMDPLEYMYTYSILPKPLKLLVFIIS